MAGGKRFLILLQSAAKGLVSLTVIPVPLLQDAIGVALKMNKLECSLNAIFGG
jgi:hypothetical protein